LPVTAQVTSFLAVAPLLGEAAVDGAADAPGLGWADGLELGLGVAALAIPLNDSVPAAVRISTAES
jgi:hypothetical protein